MIVLFMKLQKFIYKLKFIGKGKTIISKKWHSGFQLKPKDQLKPKNFRNININ